MTLPTGRHALVRKVWFDQQFGDLSNRDLLWMPEPSGGDDRPTLDALLTLAKEPDTPYRGIGWRSGIYKILSGGEVLWPDGLSMIGCGIDLTTIYTNASSWFRFGVIDNVKASDAAMRYPMVSGFSLHGGGTKKDANGNVIDSLALTPMRVGHITSSAFRDVEITSASSAGPALLIQTAQNTSWINVQVDGNYGDGVWWDLSANNHTVVDCIFRQNGGAGQRFTRSGPTPPNTANGTYPRNIKIVGGLQENNVGGDVCIESGDEIWFIGAQMSQDDTCINPAFWIKDWTSPDGVKPVVGHISFLAGQMRGRPGNLTVGGTTYPGLACRVERGILTMDDDVNVRTSPGGVEINDNGYVQVGYVSQQNIGQLFKAIGSLPLRELMEYNGIRVRQPYADTPCSTTVLTPVPGLAVTLDPDATTEFHAFIAYNGDPTDDLKLSIDVPTGATARWTVGGSLGSGATTATFQTTAALLAETDTVTVGALLTPTVVAHITGTVTTVAGGQFDIRAAKAATNTTTSTVVTADSWVTFARRL